MLKRLSVFVALIAAVQVFAFTGSVVSSFVSPHGSSWPKGIDYYSGYLYHGSNYSYNRIYVTTTAGSITSTITSPAATMGVDNNGTYIWTCSYSPAYIYRMSTAGSVLGSFAGPAAGYGVASEGSDYLWYSSATSDTIYKLTTTGSVVLSFPHPGTFAGDLDFDGTYLWISDWPSSNGGIYKLTTTGSLVDSMVPAVGATRPSGVCWDGTYLWYNDYQSPYLCLRVAVQYTSIQPASLGRVKALYR